MFEFINKKSKFNKICKSYDYDIILIAGQSNAEGYGKGYEYLKYIPHDPIYEYIHNKGFRFASDKKYGFRNIAASFALYFGEEYCNGGLLKNYRKLLLLNTAVGGTGFSDNRWKWADDLSVHMINIAKELLSINSNNRIKAFLWHQGEADVLSHMSSLDYEKNLKLLIKNTREALNIENVPFISGNMVPEWMEKNPYSFEIAAVTRNLMNKLPFCGYVESDDLTGNDSPDIIHFSRKSCLELGKRYFDKYKTIIK